MSRLFGFVYCCCGLNVENFSLFLFCSIMSTWNFRKSISMLLRIIQELDDGCTICCFLIYIFEFPQCFVESIWNCLCCTSRCEIAIDYYCRGNRFEDPLVPHLAQYALDHNDEIPVLQPRVTLLKQIISWVTKTTNLMINK